MRNAITNIEGVERILSFESTFDNQTREWDITYSALGENGTTVEGEIT